MNMEEIREGDCILFENQYGKVDKIKGDKALCRFYGFKKWVEIVNLIKRKRNLES